MSKKKDPAIKYEDELDKIEEDLGLMSVHMSRVRSVEYAISSGSLCLDTVLGGGWAPGRLTVIYGPEASGKSTLIENAICNAAAKGIGSKKGDAEGSTDPNYLSQIASLYGLKLKQLFGERDEKGNWAIPPLLRHYQPTTGEGWFRLLKRALNKLPDRKMVKHGDKRIWMDIWEDGTKEKAPDGRCQGVWFMDSLPAFVPEDIEEDDEKNAMSQVARMYSEQLPSAMSKVVNKRIALIATNQLREKPMAFGNPWYEPCGNAPKFYSSVRVSVEGLSFSNQKAKAWPKPESVNVYREKSWDYSEDNPGRDRYRLVKICVTKNKVFTPFLTTYIRLWIGSREGVGYGIDPVYDTAQYLRETGQMWKGEGAGMKGKFEFADSIGIKKPLSWRAFKALILDPKNKDRIRHRCFKQIRSGDAFKLFFAMQAKAE